MQNLSFKAMLARLVNKKGGNGFSPQSEIVELVKEHQMLPGLLPDVYDIRGRDFPLLDEKGRVYLDSTATSQEPQSVKERIHEYRKTTIRGSTHADNSTEAREAQRDYLEVKGKMRDFFNAQNYDVVFTSGTTASSNMLAINFPFEKGDLLLLTEMEHNSQILTVRNFAGAASAEIIYIPVSLPDGRLDLEYLTKVVTNRKKGGIFLNLVHVSNVTGVINPVKKIRKILGDRGLIYLDMAQSAGHLPLDLDDLDVDFAAVSAHKMYGPMGVGALFVNKRSEKRLLSKLDGGDTLMLVGESFVIHKDSPERFEPGTQNIEGVIEWGFALDYLKQIGMKNIEEHDRVLGEYFMGELQQIYGVEVYGPTKLPFKDRTAVITFNVGPFMDRNYDQIARELDKRSISVRDGCFCANIYVRKLLGEIIEVPETNEKEAILKSIKDDLSKNILKPVGAVRASFAFYNTLEDARKAVEAIREITSQ